MHTKEELDSQFIFTVFDFSPVCMLKFLQNSEDSYPKNNYSYCPKMERLLL